MFRRAPRTAVSLATALLLLVGLTVAMAPTALAAGVTATFTKTQDWGTGFGGKYTVVNDSGATVTGWQVEFDLLATQRISSLWNGRLTNPSANHYVVTDAGWNGTLAPGASTSFGFNGSYSGTWRDPANCTVNGGACDGSGGGGGGDDTTPPSAPGNLRATSVGTTSVSLAWDPATDNVGVEDYLVARNGSQVGTPSGTSFTASGLQPDTQYTFTVRARDAAGNTGPASNQLSVTTRSDGGGGGGPPGDMRNVAYFTAWGIYEARDYFVKNIVTSGSAEKLTHINYAFGNVSQDGRCFIVNQTGVGDAWADYQKGFTAAQSVDGVGDVWNQELKGNFNQLRKLKEQFPHIKVLISLGGWTWSKYFSDAALTDASRREFVSSCIDLYLRGNLPEFGGNPAGGPGTAFGVFDGIDIDWEYPAAPGNVGNIVRPEDTRNFTLLLQEFRRQLDAFEQETGREYLLTAALSAGKDKIDKLEVANISQVLDFMNIMTYDFHGAWDADGPTNFLAPLFPSPNDPSTGVERLYNVDDAISEYINRGAPASKLNMGIPFYGRGWRGVTNENNGLYQPATGPADGHIEDGVEDYKVLKTLNYPSFRDPITQAFWVYNGSTFWSYDDPVAIQAKTDYIADRGLGGAFSWSLDSDDAQGTLMTALHGGLNG